MPFIPSTELLNFAGIFVSMAGFVIGLGAVTVIDIHGFLGRKSSYWTQATTQTHKVTKPMIWIGMFLAVSGGMLLYRNEPFIGIPLVQTIIACALVINGCFLSFGVSPFLLKREREGKSDELVPQAWQRRITVSLILSDIGWWGSLVLLAVYITMR